MNRRNVLVMFGAALAAPLALASAARACGPSPAFTKAVPFPAGSKDAKIRQTIKGDYTHEWVLKGQPGQKVEIALDATKSGVTLMPDTAKGPKPNWGVAPKDGSFVRKWAGTLPKSGRMLIEVSTETSRETYTLVVKLV